MRLLMDASMRFEIKDGAGWTMAEGVCSSLAAAAQIQSVLEKDENSTAKLLEIIIRTMIRHLETERLGDLATQLGFVVQDRKTGGSHGQGE